MAYQHWSYDTLHRLCMEAFQKFGFTEADALAYCYDRASGRKTESGFMTFWTACPVGAVRIRT